jgi:hypothetical protein
MDPFEKMRSTRNDPSVYPFFTWSSVFWGLDDDRRSGFCHAIARENKVSLIHFDTAVLTLVSRQEEYACEGIECVLC